MSLRLRLALTFALVVAISLLVAGGSLWALLRGYSDRLVQARLDDIAIVALLQARSMLQRGQTPTDVLDFLADQAEELDVRILLLDRDGRVVREAHPGGLLGLRIPLERERPPPLPPRRQPIQGAFTSPRDGQVYLYAAMPLAQSVRSGDTNALLVAQPEGSPLATLGPLLPRLGLAAAAGLLAGLLAAALVARWLGRPLARLVAATQAIARGDYTQRVAPTGPPELAELGDSFNRMAAEVERSRQIVNRFIGTLSHELRTPPDLDPRLRQRRARRQRQLPLRPAPRHADRRPRGPPHAAPQHRATRPLPAPGRPGAPAPRARRAARPAGPVRRGANRPRRGAPGGDRSRPPAHLGGRRRRRSPRTGLHQSARQCPEVHPLRSRRPRHRPLSRRPRAARPTPPRGPAIRPPAHPPPDRPTAVVEIANPGPPIPPDALPRIFEQFYTTPDGRDRGGTGLGLPIAREIARAHGGDLTAQSADGWTTFRLSLPAAAPFRDAPVTPPPLTTEPRS